MIRVAFQGVKGAFSEDAIVQFFGEKAESVPCPDFESVFRAVDQGRVAYGMVPVENSLEGSVSAVSDLLLDFDLNVVGEAYVAIVQNLIAHPGVEIREIKRVYSHPQALGQSRAFLAKYPQWEKVPAFDTAGSVRIIRDHGLREEAAIASRRAAQEYGMTVLREGIQNSDRNFTRFFVIQKTPALSKEGDKTSVVFAVRNMPGTLYRALGAFDERGVNMTKLESRPRKDRQWEYVFYVDLDGHVDDKPVADALTDLVRRASFVKVLGTYRRAQVPG
ncbi:prephenate dehydratase [Methanomassiliicoccus luminyensis]|uniref:prephenate dehydratase n=1 Tax=Methanomassiliicoccus luminyensis TaxID=1080712 RepID=UPI000AD958FC|nr:prephenate dehydratase [Methanomassiliicoccus luminyensis]